MRFNVSIADMISSPAKLKVAKFLLTNEASMSEREIASILKISHMSVNRVMAQLVGINFVALKTIGKSHVWTVNRKSYAYGVVKAVLESVKSQPAPLVALKERVLKCLPKSGVVRVVLFGSVAQGKEHTDSDIDLFIVVKSDKDKMRLEPSLDKLSTECLDMFGNRLAPYVLSERELKAKRSLAVVQVAEKGEVLYDGKV